MSWLEKRQNDNHINKMENEKLLQYILSVFIRRLMIP